MAVVLVTGGAGYIGSHACKKLKADGHIPVTFDNFSTGWRDAVKFGPFVEGDLLDPESLKIAFDLHQPDAVMHFAALSQVGESMTNPAIYWRNNVAGSNNLLDAASNAGCSNFIFSSTCATYGEQDNVVLNESSAQKPINAYGKSKRAIEEMLVDYEAAHGMKHVIFRYFNVAGADPDSDILLRRSDCFVARKIWSGADLLYSHYLQKIRLRIYRRNPIAERLIAFLIWRLSVV